jgi:hypothetical protein
LICSVADFVGTLEPIRNVELNAGPARDDRRDRRRDHLIEQVNPPSFYGT